MSEEKKGGTHGSRKGRAENGYDGFNYLAFLCINFQLQTVLQRNNPR